MCRDGVRSEETNSVSRQETNLRFPVYRNRYGRRGVASLGFWSGMPMISWRCAGTESGVREALRRIGLVMSWPGLTLHPTKTQLVNLRRGKEGFVFLGSMIRKKRSILRLPGNHFMQRWPSPKATQKIRDRVRELTGARQSGQRCEADHRRTERRASRLGTLLPNGECRSGVHQTGSLCRPAD